ncbi:MAG TPA: N-methyl-L-tryptophan oxidase, partial [Phycisphaerales bacterium]|nr:N-methyl-L-tryptophan oxidase [Phycisphaerales bacterium]
MPHYDAITVGLGSMGSAALYHLASRGRRVLGLDRLNPPHTRGSHGGLTRMTRLVYAEHPDYVPLLQRANDLWRDLERRTNQTILHATGGVYIGPADSLYIAGAIESASRHSLPYELLEGRDLASRFPWFRTPPRSVAIADPGAGFLFPHRAIEAHLSLARAHGADIHPDEPVLEWHADSRGVAVRTSRAEYTADKLILSAGAWMPQLLTPPGGKPAVDLTVTRQTLCWVDPPDPAPFALGRFPVWAFTLDGRTVYYGFPMTPQGGAGLKLAHHAPLVRTNPDTDPRTATPADALPILDFLREHLPGGLGPVRDQQVCLYTNTQDEHFVVDLHPDHPNVAIASPCSGHGFKFGSVIGETLADLADTGAARHDIRFLSATRF